MFYNIYPMRNKKILLFTITFICCLILLTGCKQASDMPSVSDTDQRISIVCTTFPQYDWIRNILGGESDAFRLTLLLDTGVDSHSYQPSARDIALISSADIFIYTGGESDQWVEDILKEPFNPDIQAVSLLAALGDAAREEEMIEGMQERWHYGEEEEEYDEHVWLSLRNAAFYVRFLSGIISGLDGAHAALYTENANNYIALLNDLDLQYEQAVSAAKSDILLFGDRFPFRYLTEDYGLRYYAAFPGCSAETEAGFDTVTFLSGKLDELHLKTILVIEHSDTRIAETIRQNTASRNQNILELNSIQSVTKTDLKSGFTYLGAMRDNLEILKQALDQEEQEASAH